MEILTRVLGGVLFAFSIWYILVLFKNNRDKF